MRFGFELIETICHKYDCKIEIIDSTEKVKDEELIEDLTQIITVLSCRLQGKHANKTKQMIKELVSKDDNI